MIESIIFDMDGTLWDSAENVAAAWNKAVSGLSELSEKRFSADDIRGVMGLTMDAIAARFFPDASEQTRAEILRRCCDIENDYLRVHGGGIYPDTAAATARLAKRFRLFIVSNCQAGYIEAFLDHYGLWEHITDRLCWGDNGLRKSENIRLIMQKNNVKPERALYVGDTQTDRDSARAAGVKFAFASYGFGDVDGFDFKLNSLSELCEILK